MECEIYNVKLIATDEANCSKNYRACFISTCIKLDKWQKNQ